jgi:hypothetical protein
MRMIYKSLPVLLTLLCLTSCISNEETRKVETSQSVHERLIEFSSKNIMTMDDISELDEATYQKLHSKDFNSETDTIKLEKDKLSISYLAITNGCADYTGDIAFKSDTIFLKLINVGEVECTEESVDRVVFIIKNPDNIKYKIVKW